MFKIFCDRTNPRQKQRRIPTETLSKKAGVSRSEAMMPGTIGRKGKSMPDQSRRKFLLAAGAGSVAVGAGVIVAPALAGGVTGDPVVEAGPIDTGDGSQVLAYVSDPKHDEVTLMVDDRESVVRDRVLARALSNAAKNQAG